jgi:CheY-like chemotaxis protein
MSFGFSQKLNGLSVLVVDDEADSRQLVVCVLERNGASVHQADAPAAALAILSEHAPDVIVSDIGMPGEDGYSLIRQVRSLDQDEKRTIPAIAVTGFTRNRDRLQAFESGFNMHMSKPLDPAKLLEAVLNLTRSQSS